MREITLKTEHHFDAAHMLENYRGKCANLHGHRWRVVVCVRGAENRMKNNMLVDFIEIKKEIDNLDHTFLNEIFTNPTAEQIALYLLDTFEKKYPHLRFKIILSESPGCDVEVESDGY